MWQPDQIVTWQPDKRTRSWEDEGILYTRGNPKKSTAFWRSHLWNWTRFLGADSDGMMEGIPLSFFWNSLACIFWPDVLWIWKYVTCRESNGIERGRKRNRRKKDYIQDTTVGKKLLQTTPRYVRRYQLLSLRYKTTLLQLHNFEERETWYWFPRRKNFNRAAQTKHPGKRLWWSRGSVLAFGTQVRGFKPVRSRRIFQGEKILSTPSLGGEVKEVK